MDRLIYNDRLEEHQNHELNPNEIENLKDQSDSYFENVIGLKDLKSKSDAFFGVWCIMKKSTDTIQFDWKNTGKLDINVDGNLSATIRYKPSDKFVKETLEKLNKKPANQSNYEKHINSKE